MPGGAATASPGPIPPPVLQLPWGLDPAGRPITLTQSAFEFLQLLWAGMQGGGGVIDNLSFVQGLAVSKDGMLAELTKLALIPAAITFSTAEVSTKPTNTIVARVPMGVPLTFPVAFFGSVGKVKTAPTADTTFDLQIDGVSIGSAIWQAGSTVATFAKVANTVAVATDYLDLVTPANLNGMSGAMGLTLLGAKQQ